MDRTVTTSGFRARIGRAQLGRRSARLGILLAATAAAGLLHASPALAEESGSRVGPPECERVNSELHCFRFASAWTTNDGEGYSNDNRGAYHALRLRYISNRPSSTVYVTSDSWVWDFTASGSSVDRMRLTETFKALGPGGGSIGISWGGVTAGEEGAEVSARQVRLSMTRENRDFMSRGSSLAFPRGSRAHSVELVSNSTTEYPSGNLTRRLVSTGRLSDY